MIFNTNLDELNTVLTLTNWLAAFRDNSPIDAFYAMLYADGSRNIQVRYRAGDRRCPGLLWGVTDAGHVCLADGCQTLEQGIDFFRGYIGDPFRGTSVPTNPYLDFGAGYVRELLQQSSLPLVGIPFLCGYSLGGAILTNYGAGFAQRNGFMPKTLTLGSPKALNPSTVQLVRGPGVNLRLMTDVDPIPLVPLRMIDSPAQALLLTPYQVRSISYFVHTDGGVTISDAGTFANAIVPPLAAANPQTALADWLVSQDTSQQGPHGLNNYRSRLRTAIAVQNRGIPVAPPGAPAEQANPVAPRQVAQAERAVVNTIFHRGEIQNQQPVLIPTVSEFSAFRQGRIWLVAWRNQIVAIGPTKRRARAMAREGNAFLRRMPTLAYVNTAEVTGQLASYFSDASGGDAAFAPPIQNELPT